MTEARGQRTPGSKARLEELVGGLAEVTVYFDLLAVVDHDTYESLAGVGETLAYDANTGELTWAKDIHLPGGTVTVETSYERVAA